MRRGACAGSAIHELGPGAGIWEAPESVNFSFDKAFCLASLTQAVGQDNDRLHGAGFHAIKTIAPLRGAMRSRLWREPFYALRARGPHYRPPNPC
jgi:hypothetical protein